MLLLTLKKHRVTVLKSFCEKNCSISFCIVKAVLKPLQCYQCLCKSPFALIKCNKAGGLQGFDVEEEEESCNWSQVADFAVKSNLCDPLLIQAHYLDFAKNAPCEKCLNLKTEAHKFHSENVKNAMLFATSKSQRSIVHQAADIVQGKKRLELVESSRKDLFKKSLVKQFNKLKKQSEEQLIKTMLGVAWYCCLFDDMPTKLKQIIKLLVDNEAKNRNILFQGDVNSGKTTLACALMDLLQGKALNINCNPDKINFELGCAMDQFMCIFEDVKGQATGDLPGGPGVSNLDNMRDYLDGTVPVNLEKKHANKTAQIFPPNITTMNNYKLPVTLRVRYALCLQFNYKTYLAAALETADFLVTERILHCGLTIFLLLLYCSPIEEFDEDLREELQEWKDIVLKLVSWTKFCEMIENIESGNVASLFT